MKPIKPVDRPPLIYLSVQDAIREYIIENNLQPGDLLPPENELARQLEVSRTSVREAIRSLESLGVIETRRGSGLYVRDFSFEPILNNLQYGLLTNLNELSDLLQVRRVLEMGMIGLAMESMSTDQKQRLMDVLERMRQRAQHGEAFTSEDHEFHALLFEHLHNTILIRLLDIFWQAFNSSSKHSPIWDADPVWTYNAHRAIVDAIIAGDADRARQALDEHYSSLVIRLARINEKREEE